MGSPPRGPAGKSLRSDLQPEGGSGRPPRLESPALRGLQLLTLAVELAVFGLTYDVVYRLTRHQGWWTESLFRQRGGFVFERPGWLLAFCLAYFLFFPVLRTVFGRWRIGDFGLRLDNWASALRFTCVLLLFAILLSHLGLLLFPQIFDQAWRAYGVRSSVDLMVFLFLLVPLVAGIGEELFFRSYLQGGLTSIHRSWGPLVAALTFALAHHFQGWVPLLAFHVPGALLFAGTYRRTRSLLAVVPAHILFDLVIFLELYVIYQHQPGWRTVLALSGIVVAIGGGVVLRRTLLQLARELVDLFIGLVTQPWWGLFSASLIVPLMLVSPRFLLVMNYRARQYGLTTILLLLALGLVALIGLTIAARRLERRQRDLAQPLQGPPADGDKRPRTEGN